MSKLLNHNKFLMINSIIISIILVISCTGTKKINEPMLLRNEENDIFVNDSAFQNDSIFYGNITWQRIRKDWQYYQSGIYPFRVQYGIANQKDKLIGKSLNFIYYVFGIPNDKKKDKLKKITLTYFVYEKNPEYAIIYHSIKIVIHNKKVIDIQLWM